MVCFSVLLKKPAKRIKPLPSSRNLSQLVAAAERGRWRRRGDRSRRPPAGSIAALGRRPPHARAIPSSPSPRTRVGVGLDVPPLSQSMPRMENQLFRPSRAHAPTHPRGGRPHVKGPAAGPREAPPATRMHAQASAPPAGTVTASGPGAGRGSGGLVVAGRLILSPRRRPPDGPR